MAMDPQASSNIVQVEAVIGEAVVRFRDFCEVVPMSVNTPPAAPFPAKAVLG